VVRVLIGFRPEGISYLSSSLLDVVGEELESVTGKIRDVCNSNLHPPDVRTAQAARDSLWRAWAEAMAMQ
jgi:hypothetical protein